MAGAHAGPSLALDFSDSDHGFAVVLGPAIGC